MHRDEAAPLDVNLRHLLAMTIFRDSISVICRAHSSHHSLASSLLSHVGREYHPARCNVQRMKATVINGTAAASEVIPSNRVDVDGWPPGADDCPLHGAGKLDDRKSTQEPEPRLLPDQRRRTPTPSDARA
jgi:hypothetical protein